MYICTLGFVESLTGRDWTVSIAIPGSLLAPVLQYPDIASLTAYHIARMVISFGADEVIVYSDDGSPPLPLPIGNPRSIPFQPPCKLSDDPTAYLATLLYFYQTPRYLSGGGGGILKNHTC